MSKLIVVDFKEREAIATEAGKPFHKCDCVGGDKDHPTPTGKFKIFRMEHPYTSKKYNVPMNYAMFFVGGVALHQYHGPAPWWWLKLMRGISSNIGSHGCVRLQEDDAKKLYGWARRGTIVEVR